MAAVHSYRGRHAPYARRVCTIWPESMHHATRFGCTIAAEYSDYDSISSSLKTHSYEEILNVAAELANASSETLEVYPKCDYSVGMASGTYRFTLLDLLKNVQHYDWLYSRLEDDASRMVFANLVAYRLFPSTSF